MSQFAPKRSPEILVIAQLTIKCVSGRLYWDPSESTVKKYTETSANGGYADVLESHQLAKDFTGLSTLLLGQAQPKQFQTYDIDRQSTGWKWVSHIKTDGTFENDATLGTLDSTEYGAMSRSWNYSAENAYYNYFAATAESSGFQDIGYASDSICPSGWKLSKETIEGDASYYNLFYGAYELSYTASNSSDKTSMKTATSFPLSFTFSGYYQGPTGLLTRYAEAAYYMTLHSIGNQQVRTFDMDNTGYFSARDTDRKFAGYVVRCVMVI